MKCSYAGITWRLMKGYKEEAWDKLDRSEKESLYLSPYYMTLIMGVRFLTDYIQGNTYYRVEYEAHNLVRAKNQLHVCRELAANKKELKQLFS